MPSKSVKCLAFATDDVDRVCLGLDLEVFLDPCCDGGSEVAIVGICASGNRLPPGLSDLDILGQGISLCSLESP
jgi:hypothetical protein